MKWISILSVVLCLWTGCEDPKTDMGAQAKYKPAQPSASFADGMSERPLVAGVVDRDQPAVDHADTVLTAESIARGQEQFDIYCAVCHGRLGNGEGMIVERGLTRPPSFHIDRLKQAPDSHFQEVIQNGFGAMFNYQDRIPLARRFEIVAYIRALQAAAEVAHAPERVQEALIAGGDRETPNGAPR